MKHTVFGWLVVLLALYVAFRSLICRSRILFEKTGDCREKKELSQHETVCDSSFLSRRSETPMWCARGDSNPYAKAMAPKTIVSTNSTTGAYSLF